MRRIAILLGLILPLAAQTPASKSFVGTLTGFRAESAEVEIKPDAGEAVIGKLTPDTLAQKIAPGSTNLKNAESIKITDLAKGDRVLVTLEPGTTNVRRIVVMSAADIAQRNDTDRAEWQKRCVAGIVSAKSGNTITVKSKSLTGETTAVVTVSEQTAYKRYAPDSVKFTDAKTSKLADVAVGDQLRARGQKSEDGLQVTAEEIVFGTFLIKAGAITAVHPETQEFSVKELGTNKTITIKLTADSQVKQMPNLPAGMMGGGRQGMAAGGPPAGGRAGVPGGFDINQMLEHMPAVKLDELKAGSTVVISSTKGARADAMTAILVLANADMLIQMAAAMNGGNRGASMSGMGGQGMMGSDMGSLMGLGLGGMQ